jgi:peptidoglycan/LPS O-acetylase OafA/YrhL
MDMKSQDDNQPLKHTYVPAFDGLRGTVLTVMFMHLEVMCPVFAGHHRTRVLLFSQTWYTLNIFFCLSGFLITWLLVNEIQTTGKLNLLRFYRRRTVRLLPAYLSAVILSCWLATLWGFAPKEIVHDLIYFLTYSYNIAISMRGGGATAAALAFFLVPVWSLCVEEQFYFAWSIALKCLKMKYALKATMSALVFLAVYRCAVLFHMLHTGTPGSDIGRRFYYGTDMRIDAILVGCAAALALQQRRYYDLARKYLSAKALPYLLPVIIAVIVFLTAAQGITTTSYQLYGDVISTSLLAAWIVSIYLQPTSLVSQVLGSRPFVWLGRISYGIYIFHPIVIRIVTRLMNISTPPYFISRNLAAWFLVSVITALIATVHFHLIELPLQRRFKGAIPIPAKPRPDFSLAPVRRPQPTAAAFSTRTPHLKS